MTAISTDVRWFGSWCKIVIHFKFRRDGTAVVTNALM